ncbi:MAG TPA: MFS transporter [Candidatus Limnocylindrales bacterium]|nr:MFS transporter [Candidatus Limnocylindrales bacterium]
MDPVTDLKPLTDAPVAAPAHRSLPGGQDDAADQGLRHNRDLRIVLVGQGISAVGDAISVTTMPLLVLALTGSGLQMGIVGVLQRLPDLLFSLPAGAFADRWDRRRMMLWADAGRAVLTALIPLASVFALPVMVVVLLVAFPINVCRVIFMAGWTATVPNLVGRRQLGRALGVFEAISGGSFIVGPAIAGLLVGRIGAAPTLAIDAVSFGVSALSLALIRRPLRRSERQPGTALRHEIAEGVRFVVRHPVLRDTVAFWSVVSLVSAPVIPAVTYYVTIDRALGPAAFGFVISAYSVGTLVGALLAGRRMSGRLAPQLLLGNLVVAFTTAGVALSGSLPVMFVLAFASGAFQSIVLVAYITVRAANSPDELLGRVGSTTRTISLGLRPVGLLVGGLLLDSLHGGPTLLLIAALTGVTSLAFALSPGVRAAHAMPRSPSPGLV